MNALLHVNANTPPRGIIMNIVVEGPDNSGKSTLCAHLARATGRRIIPGKGPCTPQTWGHRFTEFDGLDNVIFDRHACVSEPIFSPICREIVVPLALTRRFYAAEPLIIYCRNTRGLDGHVEKQFESAAHLAMVKLRHQAICQAYDVWALDHAHVIYRIGDDVSNVVSHVVAEAA